MTTAFHDKGYRAPAVKKAFELLTTVARSSEELGISDLARELGLGKSTVYGLTQTLIEVALLARLPGKKGFILGPAIGELAFSRWNPFWISEKAAADLVNLRDVAQETVFLGFQSSTRVIIIASAEGPGVLKISAPAGTSIPLLAGAVGKALLARKTDAEAVQLIRKQGLKSYTPCSVGKEEDYLAELDLVRRQGYALDREEYLPGINAAACALDNKRGLPLILWVVGFLSSLGEERLLQVIPALCRTAEKLKTTIDEGP